MVSLTFLYVIREIIGFLEPGRTKANSVIFQFFASQKLAIVSRFPNFGGGGIKLISFDWFLRQLQISSSHTKYKLTKVFLPQWNFIQRYPVNMTANWLKNAIVCFSIIWKHRVHWRLAKILEPRYTEVRGLNRLCCRPHSKVLIKEKLQRRNFTYTFSLEVVKKLR